MENHPLHVLHPNKYDQLVMIHLYKREMIEFGLKLGLSHPITVSLSQRLDQIITEYQKSEMIKIRH